MHKNNLRLIDILIGTIPPFMGAVSYLIGKSFANEIPPISLAYYRLLVCIFFMAPIAFKVFYQQKNIVLTNIKILSLIAFTGITLFPALTYYAAYYTSLVNIGIISSTFPVYVILLSYFLDKHRLNIWQIISIFTAFIGTFIILSKGNASAPLHSLFDNIGDYITIIAAIVWGIYIYTSKHKPKELRFFSFVYATILLGFVFLTPIYIWESLTTSINVVWDYQKVSAILFLGIGVSSFGLLALNYSVQKLGPNLSAIIYYLCPVFSAMLEYFVLDSALCLYHYIGMLMIIVGVNIPFIAKYLRY